MPEAERGVRFANMNEYVNQCTLQYWGYDLPPPLLAFFFGLKDCP